MKPLVVSLLGEHSFGEKLAQKIGGELAEMELRSFPDDESYVRIDSPVAARDVIVLADLHRPNSRFLPLMFVAETLHELGARSIGLAAPYLPYMRQDACFRPGEGMTSRFFARIISRSFDWLVTVDPHLHRYNGLEEVYSIPAMVVQSAGPIATWIAREVDNPIVVGPDEESEQWVSAVAEQGGFPYLILEKNRHGDYDVEVSGRPAPVFANQQPVILDDIISTGRTMVEAARYLASRDLRAPICLGIHALFVGDALGVVEKSGVAKVVTCNTVGHQTNEIDIQDEFARGVEHMLAGLV